MFNAILEQVGLRELDLNGIQFIWENNLKALFFEKLDRIRCCPDWEENYPLTEVTTLVREKSDDTPLFLDSGDVPKTDPIFRFENILFLRHGIQKIVTGV